MDYFNDNAALSGIIEEKVLVLDITKSLEMFYAENPGATPTSAHIMAYAQRAWALSAAKANQAELIFACANEPPCGATMRCIKGVFVIGRNGNDVFVKSPWPGDGDRCVFLAEPAAPVYREKYIGKYLAPRQQGEANPVKYNY